MFKLGFFDKKHLVDEAIKFPLTLSENAKLAFFEEACVPMGFQEMFSNHCVLVFHNALVEVSSCVAPSHRSHEKEYTTHC